MAVNWTALSAYQVQWVCAWTKIFLHMILK